MFEFFGKLVDTRSDMPGQPALSQDSTSGTFKPDASMSAADQAEYARLAAESQARVAALNPPAPDLSEVKPPETDEERRNRGAGAA